MVIMVEAGAVAAESAPSTTEKARERCSTRYIRKNTSAVVSRASSAVITSTFAPFFRSVSSLKYSPVLKAMKLRAMSGRKPEPRTKDTGITFRHQGPIRTPVRM